MYRISHSFKLSKELYLFFLILFSILGCTSSQTSISPSYDDIAPNTIKIKAVSSDTRTYTFYPIQLSLYEISEFGAHGFEIQKNNHATPKNRIASITIELDSNNTSFWYHYQKSAKLTFTTVEQKPYSLYLFYNETNSTLDLDYRIKLDTKTNELIIDIHELKYMSEYQEDTDKTVYPVPKKETKYLYTFKNHHLHYNGSLSLDHTIPRSNVTKLTMDFSLFEEENLTKFTVYPKGKNKKSVNLWCSSTPLHKNILECYGECDNGPIFFNIKDHSFKIHNSLRVKAITVMPISPMK